MMEKSNEQQQRQEHHQHQHQHQLPGSNTTTPPYQQQQLQECVGNVERIMHRKDAPSTTESTLKIETKSSKSSTSKETNYNNVNDSPYASTNTIYTPEWQQIQQDMVSQYQGRSRHSQPQQENELNCDALGTDKKIQIPKQENNSTDRDSEVLAQKLQEEEAIAVSIIEYQLLMDTKLAMQIQGDELAQQQQGFGFGSLKVDDVDDGDDDAATVAAIQIQNDLLKQEQDERNRLEQLDSKIAKALNELFNN